MLRIIFRAKCLGLAWGEGLKSDPHFAPKSLLRVFPNPAAFPQPSLARPFIAVAYYFLANSRLECSPDLGYDSAYHTTFCKSRVNTNYSFTKKIPTPTGQRLRPLRTCKTSGPLLTEGLAFTPPRLETFMHVNPPDD